jgi:hypothetical protein
VGFFSVFQVGVAADIRLPEPSLQSRLDDPQMPQGFSIKYSLSGKGNCPSRALVSRGRGFFNTPAGRGCRVFSVFRAKWMQ